MIIAVYTVVNIDYCRMEISGVTKLGGHDLIGHCMNLPFVYIE